MCSLVAWQMFSIVLPFLFADVCCFFYLFSPSLVGQPKKSAFASNTLQHQNITTAPLLFMYLLFCLIKIGIVCWFCSYRLYVACCLCVGIWFKHNGNNLAEILHFSKRKLYWNRRQKLKGSQRMRNRTS